MEEVVKYLKALVFLQVSAQADGPPIRPELLLQKAGLKLKEIAEVMGKKETAVAKTISRAKASSKEGTDGQ